MNDFTRGAPQDLTAQQLADLPLRTARKALIAQEVRYMTERLGAAVLDQVQEIYDGIARVVCVHLDDELKRFHWQGHSTAEPQPDEEEAPAVEFVTDYSGDLVEDEG